MFTLLIFTILLPQPSPLYIVSPDFADGGSIPAKFTCDGEGIYPTLIVNGMPQDTESLVLIVEDPDAPDKTQWMLWNIPPMETITDNNLRELDAAHKDGGSAYRGLCPANDSGQRYTFRVYALDELLNLRSNAGREEIENAIRDHVVASGQLQGEYSRSVVTGRKRKK